MTEVIDGALLSTVTVALVSGMPVSSPSFGVALHWRTSPASKLVPSMLALVTEGPELTVHSKS